MREKISMTTNVYCYTTLRCEYTPPYQTFGSIAPVAKVTVRIMVVTLMMFVVSALFLCTGCSSVRWSGDTVTHSLNKDIELKSKYRVERICFTAPPASRTGNQTIIAAIMDVAGKSQFKAQLPKIRPDVFTESSDSVPIVVNMILKDENGQWEIGPYILTLGLLPGERHDDCLFQIDVQRIPDMKRTKGTLATIKYDFRMSLFTPLGLIGFDHDDSVAICRETIGTSKEVQPATIAAAIVDQLHQLEAEDQKMNSTPLDSATTTTIPFETTQPVGIGQELKKLKTLRDTGIITEKEYQDMVLRVVEQAKQ